MGLELGARLSVVQPSATVAISTRAKELKAQGVDVLSFSVGEPDFDTPAHIREAAKDAIDHGATRYTAARGTLALRKAICDASLRRRGVAHSPAEVVVSCGAKHTLFNLSMALFDPGDEVIIPAPYWVSYPAQVQIAGAKPVILDADAPQNFLITPAQLKAALSPKTKAVVLCSPSNPTGAAYDRDGLGALLEVLRDAECYVIVDEIYGELVYGKDVPSLLSLAPELKERLVIVDGVSKTYAMTGWRIGWMLANEKLCAACNKLQSQSTTNPAAVSQAATIAALTAPQESVDTMREAFEARRNYLVGALNGLEGVTCTMPDGAFYAFPDVSGCLGKKAGDRVVGTDLELCAYLLDEARCAFVPGSAFGAPGHVRFSYAASMEQLEEGIRRVALALGALSKLG
ncbi:MAG: pyridoxal phosphate-dependent aminotransferase [Myxococcota bacterium]